MAKRTVEECLILDVAELVRPSLGYPGFFGCAPLRRGKERLGLVRYLLTEDWLEVFCPFGTPPHEFSLERTPTRRGGGRVRFLCPSCGRRVGKLFLPPSEGRFLCRGCHDLSYQSRQKRVPPMLKALTLLYELREKQETSPAGGRRSAQAERREERLYRALEKLDLPGELEEPPPEGPSPKRPPGRPRKKRPYHRHQPLAHGDRSHDQQAYCVKCRDFRDLLDPHLVILSNGRPALKGACSTCGCRLARVVKGKTQPRGDQHHS